MSGASRTDPEMIENLHFVKETRPAEQGVLEARPHRRIRRIHARALAEREETLAGHEQPADRRMVRTGRANGAIGGKLVGAGGGGFLMFYAEDRKRLRRAMTAAGLEEVRFRFDFEGTKLVAAP